MQDATGYMDILKILSAVILMAALGSAIPWAVQDILEVYPCPVKNFIRNRTVNCTCTLANGGTGRHADGTPCFVKHGGYNGEPDYKGGVCLLGRCAYQRIPRGCEPVYMRVKSTKEHFNGTQVGCAFTCKGGKEFNFLPVGWPCLHIHSPGSYVKGTCKNGKRRRRILCVPDAFKQQR
ncbi:uncharacterized protein LOC125944871 [Dermacentor silvarum]|uniref:uncharacterized protein LOC125944871 n=1 Tax=Dermacentor silvarum TaxID=543639 RepID=UPI002101D49C|nr:uncharacterized protein LOC125944871 [Dermacentor silvarum]